MGITRTALFTGKQNQLALLFKALGHPARIAILQYLAKQDTCICSNLVEELGLAQATVSQHLKELKNAGMIRGTVEGTCVCYCLDEKVWIKLRKVCNEFFTERAPAGKRC